MQTKHNTHNTIRLKGLPLNRFSYTIQEVETYTSQLPDRKALGLWEKAKT
jgi:hypothetical protein